MTYPELHTRSTTVIALLLLIAVAAPTATAFTAGSEGAEGQAIADSVLHAESAAVSLPARNNAISLLTHVAGISGQVLAALAFTGRRRTGEPGEEGRTNAGSDRGEYAVTAAHFPPALAEKYTGIRYIGRGGNARVFRAIRRVDGREVAVRVPADFDEATGRCFMAEMRIWENLHHPHIVHLHAVNILPSPYAEMEYMHHSLEAVEKPVSPVEALSIVCDVAGGLACAHERGVIHRAVTPRAILLTHDGIAKIAGWDAGTPLSETREMGIVGFSLTYTAPEQIDPRRVGRPDARTDIYQLGVVLYELLTGSPPFAGESQREVSEAILHEEPRPPSAFDPALAPFDPVVARFLAKHPEDRYQSAGELIADLERLKAQQRR